jgi:Predicted membrane protein (DUF2306)
MNAPVHNMALIVQPAGARVSQAAWPARIAKPALDAAAASWYVVTVLGQLLFVVYVAGFYGRSALEGRPEDWNKVLPHGYTPGDTLGNLVLGAHLAFAVVITLGGALQLLPQLRRHMPQFHRWNGRVYLASALIMSLGGLTMMFTRKGVGDFLQYIGIGLNAVLILVFAGLALYHVRARRYDEHRRWALRLFLAVSGVWFFRIGLMAWIAVNQGPVGFDPKTFTGPFLAFLSFAQYLLPLALLQLYFLARRSRYAHAQLAMAAGLGLATLVTAGGSVAAAMFMWMPRLLPAG